MLNETGNVWRKAIPQKRDRIQSQLLVWIVGPLLALPCLYVLTSALTRSGVHRANSLEAFAASLAFALVAWKLGSATRGAALSGGLICLLLTQLSSVTNRVGTWSLVHSGLLPLAALFVLTFVATKSGKASKTKAGLAEDHKGRNAAQVIANLGVAGLASSLGALYSGQPVLLAYTVRGHSVADSLALPVMALAALAEATADTVSSEIGQAFGGRPILLATLKRVEPGTDGAISLLGTLVGIAAAAIVAAIATATLGIGTKGFLVALAAGAAGLFFDSLLGATAERRGWLGNDLVNFTSTGFAASLAFALLI